MGEELSKTLDDAEIQVEESRKSVDEYNGIVHEYLNVSQTNTATLINTTERVGQKGDEMRNVSYKFIFRFSMTPSLIIAIAIANK